MANIKKIKLVDNTEYDIVDASATHIQEITLAQWELLTPEQQASGDYVITDATGVLLSAETVPYDNTSSGLTADNVQEAIDEVYDIVSESYKNVLSDITFTEDITGTNTRAYVKQGVLYIFYQGESKSHSQGDVLFTLPDDLLPPDQIYFLYIINNTCFGNATIASTGTDKGKAILNHISSGSTTGRVYFNTSFPIKT